MSEPHRYGARLKVPGEPDKFYEIIMPAYGERLDGKHWYWHVTSLSAFKTRESKRAYGPEPWSLQTWRTIKHCTIDYDNYSWEKSIGEVLEQEPVEGVFALYRAIRYDYKKQRYV